MSSVESCSEIDELLEIGMRCKELRKEKELLRESQSQSFGLIKTLERHVSSLSEARAEDRACIKRFERELSNCSQEIDYLQDQLTSRDTEVSCLEEQVRMLELRLADMQRGQEEVDMLQQELRRSDEARDILLRELEKRDLEYSSFALCIEKLEESISSMSLESQCEIESLKLDLRKWEHMYSETNEARKKAVRENESMSQLLAAFGEQLEEAQGVINHLEEENKELRERLHLSEKSTTISGINMEELISKSTNDEENSDSNAKVLCEEPRHNLCTCSKTGGSLPEEQSQAMPLHSPDTTLKEKIEGMSREIRDYELLVKQLKEELRQEKLKAKEEAEDMVQEMAELRYQMTELLEEECKRRASVEQLCLQRIVELEAQVQKDQRNSAAPLSIVKAQRIGYL
ncbi:hypothetical protein MLD38_025003 [Melastoma candidum]|uniref:Uncharacterized protein n=1 Tax=Melastoma candidum TaxID=119954 RepID=A0ACB9NU39_9MYRT|nr:hypothetical protein MLD38_025003 [Melastoma candidum]